MPSAEGLKAESDAPEPLIHTARVPLLNYDWNL